MNISIGLDPNNAKKELSLGDTVHLLVYLDEKIGTPQDQWKLKSNSRWLISGNIILDSQSLHALPADGAITKLTISGIIHSPGQVKLEPLSFLHEASGKEFSSQESQIGESSVPAFEQKEEAPPWVLPTFSFGGWNWLLVILAGLVLFSLLGYGIYRFFKRDSKRSRLNYKDKALKALAQIQVYAKPGKLTKQEEWKKFSFELAKILRQYSNENFHFDSNDMTDKEFLQELSLYSKAKNQLENIRHILSTIDEVRYGKKALDTTLVPGLILDARKFVEGTYFTEETVSSKARKS